MKWLAVPLCLLAALVAVAGDDKDKDKDPKPPAAKLPLGKDTTFVVGPLDNQGYIDYEAALNAELSKGVTAENNANALFIQAFGPAPEGGDGLPPEYFRWLDIQLLPKEGEYLVGIGDYVNKQLGLSGERLEAFYDAMGEATRRPWAAKDVEPLAEWLKLNDKPLALVVEGAGRPEYFNPLVSRRKPGEPSNLLGTVLPSVQKCREFATALTTRAMLKLNEGKLDAAWGDLLACHRLGRLVTRGATLIESLVGIAICQIAHNASLAYLEHPDLTADRARKCLADLQKLPPVAPLADKVGVTERMMGLDTLQLLRRNGPPADNGNIGIFGEDLVLAFPDRKKAFELLDWAAVMQTMNGRYDQLAEAMRTPDRAAREKRFAKIEEELAALKKEHADEAKVKKIMEGKDAGQQLGRAMGEVLMALLTPAVQKVSLSHDRAEQTGRNLRLGFALAAYHRDTARYPAKLADLAPKYLAAVPDDVFTGKPLVYKPAEKGYLLYSLGANGKDDGGATYGEDPGGDDLPVRVPLPPAKKK